MVPGGRAAFSESHGLTDVKGSLTALEAAGGRRDVLPTDNSSAQNAAPGSSER